jgi:hypothetical protein
MAHEFDRALELKRRTGRPMLFLSKMEDRPLPLGFRRYEDAAVMLPVDSDAAITALLARLG